MLGFDESKDWQGWQHECGCHDAGLAGHGSKHCKKHTYVSYVQDFYTV